MRYVIAVIVVMVAVVGFAAPVAAADPLDPPDAITFKDVMAFCNLATEGDTLITFHADFDYSELGVFPETPASESFIIRLLAPDGSLLSATKPYVYSLFGTNGYGDIIGSFYFHPEDAPEWGGAYRISIWGLPSFYSPAITANYDLNAGHYSTAADQEASRAELKERIILYCDRFSSIYPEITLKSMTDSSNIVLSSYGDSYFSAVIPGLQQMCPKLFSLQVYVPESMPVEVYNMDTGENIRERAGTSDLLRGMNRLGEIIGVSGMFMATMFTFAGCILLCILTAHWWGSIFPGMGASFLLSAGAATMFGDVLFALSMIGGLLAGMLIMYVIFLKKA